MIDKITISTKVSDDKCFDLSKLHHLQIVLNEEGEPVKLKIQLVNATLQTK